MTFHHFYSLHKDVCWKCVCLEHFRRRNQARIKLIHLIVGGTVKMYIICFSLNFLTTNFCKYESGVTKIKALHSSVFFHIKQHLIT